MTTYLVLLDAVVWLAWSAIVGVIAKVLPARVLEHDVWLTRPRAVEEDGRVYERLAIRRWKDLVPEAGGWFGGMSKRRMPSRDRDGLCRFAAETRRAELAHWCILALAPFFALWNPPVLAVAMLAYGVGANVPCVAIQRYNRGRIHRIERRRRERVTA